jgi:hypothetical protein
MDPGITIGPSASMMDFSDPLGEGGVLLVPLRERTIFPGIVAAPRNFQHLAQHRDGIGCLLRIDEPVAAHRLPSSRAKKAREALAKLVWCENPVE